MSKLKSILLAICLLFMAGVPVLAQCKFHNTAFRSGEFLSYNLYFNWKFVWLRAGNASMSVVQSNYKGKAAYRCALITRTSETLDKMFVMRDTLLCYNTTDLEPLYFRKGAVEGKRYTVDEVFYSYPGGKVKLKQHRQRFNGEQLWKESVRNECTYDMMSIFMRARSFNPEGWKKGNRVSIPITDGTSIIGAVLEYKGKATVKADNGKKYRCLQLAYLEPEGKSNKYKEIVRFFVSDDPNHVPVRIDMFLKFGTAKAFLVGTKGVKSAMTSEVKK